MTLVCDVNRVMLAFWAEIRSCLSSAQSASLSACSPGMWLQFDSLPMTLLHARHQHRIELVHKSFQMWKRRNLGGWVMQRNLEVLQPIYVADLYGVVVATACEAAC